MDKFVKSYVDKYYFEKDYLTFKNRCGKIPDYYLGLAELTKALCCDQKIFDRPNDPLITIDMQFDKFQKGEFCIEYTTVLEISKVADLFHIQHEFSIENKDPERMGFKLDGFGGEPYALCQYNAEQKIRDFLITNGLKELIYGDMIEVIEGIDLNEIGMHNSQMTVNNALFKDLYNICDNWTGDIADSSISLKQSYFQIKNY